MTNIIDKLANFVARNGPEFEQMTKQKQRDNPRFAFLFGGENFNYYQYKVTTEQAILKKQQVLEQQHQVAAQQEKEKAAATLQPQMLSLQRQIASHQSTMPEQIQQSETNLAAQYQVMMRQQQMQIEDTILSVRHAELQDQSEKCDVDLCALDSTVQPIIESCTKEAIMNGKTWIMTRSLTEKHCELIAGYFLDSVRRNMDILKDSLEEVVVPIFCTAKVTAEEGAQTEKLDKAKLITDNADTVTKITSMIQAQYQALQNQHHEFSNHLHMQLSSMQHQLSILLQQEQQLLGGTASAASNGASGGGQGFDSGIPPPCMEPLLPFPQSQQFDYSHGMREPQQMAAGSGGGGGGDFPLPDFSKPPPGFGPSSGPAVDPATGLPPMPATLDLTPSVPYYDLPAGLMAPLVKLEETDYKPLDPKDIRLPAPAPPSDRLLVAVDAFYTQPSRERPRDSEGWEKLGLYEFFKAKQRAKNARGDRPRYSRSRSLSPVRLISQSSSDSRSASRSPTPPRRRRFDAEADKRYGYRSPSRSKSKSRSPEPRRGSRSQSTSRSSSRSRSRSPSHHQRSRSPSRSPRRKNYDRSPTQSTYVDTMSYQETDMMVQPQDTRLGESNKGHKLLMKMGWSGKGLGAEEQGIVDPVEAADIRDKNDMRKGVGIDLRDPFEQFRRNKAAGFIERMRAKVEEVTPESQSRPKKKEKNHKGN